MKNIRLIQDFIIPALDSETYGDLLKWDSEKGVFMIKWTHKARSSWTEEDSRVFIAWDQLKGRPIPQTHQEFVDSKQRLRAALRNLRTIQDVPSTDDYRRYRIIDLQEQRVKNETADIKTEVKLEVQDIPSLPRRRSARKIKVEKCIYNDSSSSDSWTPEVRPSRRQRKQANRRKSVCVKEIEECMKVNDRSSGNIVQPSEPSTSKNNLCVKKENEVGIFATEVQRKDTSSVLNPETFMPNAETGAIPKKKVPRALASITESQNINYDRSFGPTRKTKVSQEAWASSLTMKPEKQSANQDAATNSECHPISMSCLKIKEVASTSGFHPNTKEIAATSGFCPKSKELASTSGFCPKTKEIASTSGFRPNTKVTAPGFCPKIMEIPSTSGFHPNIKEVASGSGCRPKTIEVASVSGCRPKAKEVSSSSSCHPKTKEVASGAGCPPKIKEVASGSGCRPKIKTSSNTEERQRVIIPPAEPPITIRLPVKQEPAGNIAENIQSVPISQPTNNTRAQEKKASAKATTKTTTTTKTAAASKPPSSKYSDDFLCKRFDEDYLRDAWIEMSNDNPWFCGKGSSDIVFPLDFPNYNAPITYDRPMTVLGVDLTALEKHFQTNFLIGD